MKKLLYVLLCFGLFMSTLVSAQQRPGGNVPLENWSQVWNISNNYKNSVNSTNIGYQMDTFQASTIKLTTSSWSTIRSTVDTFTPAALNGDGRIYFTAAAYKGAYVVASTNPVVVCSLYKSFDGNIYTPVVGASVFTLTATSRTVPVTCSWSIEQKDARFYQVWGTASVDTASLRADYYYIKNAVYQY